MATTTITVTIEETGKTTHVWTVTGDAPSFVESIDAYRASKLQVIYVDGLPVQSEIYPSFANWLCVLLNDVILRPAVTLFPYPSEVSTEFSAAAAADIALTTAIDECLPTPPV